MTTESRNNEIIPVKEIFMSIQGEGPNVGKLSLFVRVAGCPIKCSYCDTKGAWDIQGKGIMKYTVDELKKQIMAHAIYLDKGNLVITGGEPGLYVEIFKELLSSPSFISSIGTFVSSIEIETAGINLVDWNFLNSLYSSSLLKKCSVFIICSPKFPFYKYAETKIPKELIENLYFKLVVDDADYVLDKLKKVDETFNFRNKERIYLQPKDNSFKIARSLILKGCYGCRLSLQMHKILGVR